MGCGAGRASDYAPPESQPSVEEPPPKPVPSQPPRGTMHNSFIDLGDHMGRQRVQMFVGETLMRAPDFEAMMLKEANRYKKLPPKALKQMNNINKYFKNDDLFAYMEKLEATRRPPPPSPFAHLRKAEEEAKRPPSAPSSTPHLLEVDTKPKADRVETPKHSAPAGRRRQPLYDDGGLNEKSARRSDKSPGEHPYHRNLRLSNSELARKGTSKAVRQCHTSAPCLLLS